MSPTRWSVARSTSISLRDTVTERKIKSGPNTTEMEIEVILEINEISLLKKERWKSNGRLALLTAENDLRLVVRFTFGNTALFVKKNAVAH